MLPFGAACVFVVNMIMDLPIIGKRIRIQDMAKEIMNRLPERATRKSALATSSG
jgi:hypothetical protein